MDRFVPLSASLQTLSAHLHPDEKILLHQDGVGLYDGKEKSPQHFDGRLHLTNHRIIFLNSAAPTSTTAPSLESAALDLRLIRQTEYWTGFLKSHPKITLQFEAAGAPSSSSAFAPSVTPAATTSALPSLSPSSSAPSAGRTWVCRVCGFSQTSTAPKCTLCGVARDRPSSISNLPPSSSPLPSRTGTPRLDRDQYTTQRMGTPSPLPPPLPSKPSALVDDPVPPPAPATGDRRIQCPTCTFLNHHSMSSCEICGSVLPSSSSSSTLGARSSSSAPSTPRPSTPAPSSGEAAGQGFVRLSFRKGGEKGFYAALKEALGRKEWDFASRLPGKSGATGSEDAGRGGGGIDAIMKNITLDASSRDDELDEALKDLNALMSRAREMISLAQSLNEKLASSTTASSVPSNGAEAQAQQPAQALKTLGLISAPITQEQVKDEEKYHHELARELGLFLTGASGKGPAVGKSPVARAGDKGLMQRRGVMGLDEVWCLWNRARGVALVPPALLSSAAPHLPLYTSPRLTLHHFPSGLTILHTPYYSSRAFSARLLELLDLRQAMAGSAADYLLEGEGLEVDARREGATTLEVARSEAETGGDQGEGGLGAALVKEMLEECEGRGEICRDEQGGEGVRWFRNYLVTSGGDA